MGIDNTRTRNILLLSANPKGTSQLRLAEEMRDIKEGLRLSDNRDLFSISAAEAVRPRDIRRAILTYKPNIIHFSGHGSQDEGLLFEDEAGAVKFVDGSALASLFELFANSIECVVLNACYSKYQAAEIARHINYVVGMSQEIQDKAAIEFAVGFYDGLGAGKGYDFAYKLGCNAIQMVGIKQHLIPELHTFHNLVDDSKLQLSSTDISKKYLSEVLYVEKPSIEAKNNENVVIIPTYNRNAKGLSKQQSIKLIAPQIPGTQAFEFTVVTINAQGKEIDCYQGQASCLTEELSNGVILEMLYIPEGEFWMGSPESEGKRYLNERPQHLVTIKPFFISKYPITQAQWKQVASLPEVRQKLKLRPLRSGGNNHPVTQVSWLDAVEFCNRLSQKTGRKYRLSSEAEWEYACRAGTKTPFHFGETINFNLANYDSRYPYRSEQNGIYREKTTEVGIFQYANSFGLFNMHGLVWEWCLDNWHPNYNKAPINGDAWLDSNNNNSRVMRGGSWSSEAFLCRSSSRQFNNANEAFNNIGFRIVSSV